MQALRRFASALPDAVTASLFLYAWLLPLAWSPKLVKNLVTVVLIEFLVVHSAGFLGVTLLSGDVSRLKKTGILLGLSAFYMMFVLGFAYSMEEWWPIAAFGWLLGAKFVSIWFDPKPREEDRQRMMSHWAFGVMFYLAGVFAGVIAPLPRLGLSEEVVPQLGLPGGGLWIEQPHTAISAGFIYFSLLALMKFRGWTLPANNLPAMKT